MCDTPFAIIGFHLDYYSDAGQSRQPSHPKWPSLDCQRKWPHYKLKLIRSKSPNTMGQTSSTRIAVGRMPRWDQREPKPVHFSSYPCQVCTSVSQYIADVRGASASHNRAARETMFRHPNLDRVNLSSQANSRTRSVASSAVSRFQIT